MGQERRTLCGVGDDWKNSGVQNRLSYIVWLHNAPVLYLLPVLNPKRMTGHNAPTRSVMYNNLKNNLCIRCLFGSAY